MANHRVHCGAAVALAWLACAAAAQAPAAGNAPAARPSAPARVLPAPSASQSALAGASAKSASGLDHKTAQWQKELEELERLKESYRQIEEQRAVLNRVASQASSSPAAAPVQPAAPAPAPAAAETSPAPAKAPAQVEIPPLDTQRIISGSEERLANALYMLGRYAEALDAYERAAAHAAGAESQAWTLYQSGMCNLRLGRAEQALEKLGQAISRQPDSTWARHAQWQVNAMRWSARWPSKIVP